MKESPGVNLGAFFHFVEEFAPYFPPTQKQRHFLQTLTKNRNIRSISWLFQNSTQLSEFQALLRPEQLFYILFVLLLRIRDPCNAK